VMPNVGRKFMIRYYNEDIMSDTQPGYLTISHNHG
jgi:hypothetical protein